VIASRANSSSSADDRNSWNLLSDVMLRCLPEFGGSFQGPSTPRKPDRNFFGLSDLNFTTAYFPGWTNHPATFN
jgi:hypothetical protein